MFFILGRDRFTRVKKMSLMVPLTRKRPLPRPPCAWINQRVVDGIQQLQKRRQLQEAADSGAAEAEKRHREESQRLADIVTFNDSKATQAMTSSDPVNKPDQKDVETVESLQFRGTKFIMKDD